jgi:lipopolysaccharide export LptBFGC system permease protein LptF
MNSVGSTRSILVLLFAYLVFRVTTMGFNDLGQPEIANYVQWAWLAIVIYTFVGPTVFMKSLKKELSEVKLSREF